MKKENIFLQKIIFIFIIFSITFLIKCEENDYCNKFTDCYKCSLCNDESQGACKCSWSNKGCISNEENEEKEEKDKWYSKISVCKRFDDLNGVENIYCPKSSSKKTELNLKEDKIIKYTIQPDSKGFYGKGMSLCQFEFEQSSHKDIIVTVEFSSNINKYPKVYIESTDFLDRKTKINIDKNKEIEFEQNSKINIKVLLKEEYTKSPITIKLSIKSSIRVLMIILLIIILFLTLAFLKIAIYFICKKMKNKKNKRKISSENYRHYLPNIPPIFPNYNNIFINNEQENINLKKLNKQKLDKLFKNQMIKHFYKKEYNIYDGGCSICLNKFNEKSEVSITSCKHVFHYKCIHNWLYKNVKNPKCPNCNNEILNEDKNSHEKKETDIIAIMRRYGRYNSHNRFNRNDSNRRSVTIDVYPYELNENSSQRKQIQEC